MAQFLTAKGIGYHLENIIKSSAKNLCLVTPYLQLSDTLFERLSEVHKKNIPIFLVYGKNTLSPKESMQLQTLTSLKLKYLKNLHAKCYFNEKEMILGSMNLYKFSEDNNREMGILLDAEKDQELYSEAVKEVKSIISAAETRMLDFPPITLNSTQTYTKIKEVIPKAIEKETKPIFQVNKLPKKGYCIRCGDKQTLNPEKPMCYDCYEVWSDYENYDYPEDYCHVCGEDEDVSMEKPICYGCYKTHKKELESRFQL